MMELVSKYTIDIPDDISLSDFILRNCRKHGVQKALIDPETEESWTYNEFIDQVSICSSALDRLGVRSRDKICLFLPNCIQYPVLYLAIMKLGAICVPVNHTSTCYELDYYFEDSQPVVLIAHSSNIQSVNELLHRHPSDSKKFSSVHRLKEIILVNSSTSSSSHNTRYIDFNELMSRSHSNAGNVNRVDTRGEMNRELDPPVPRSVATICYSSGTTGKPKGCEQTHYSYIANTLMQCHPSLELNPGGRGVTIAVLPMFHMFGQIVYLTHALYDGITIVVCERFSPKEYLHLVNKYQATYLHSVPPLISAITTYVEELRNKRLNAAVATGTSSQTNTTARAIGIAAATTAAASAATHAAIANSDAADATCEYMRSVECIFSSAASLAPSVAGRFKTIFPWISLIQGFGMTESMLVCLSSPTNSRLGACGQLMANCRAKVVDTNTGRLLGSRQNGEILVHSPTLMKGYLNKEEATKNSFDSSFFIKTGDIGYYDEDGYLYIVGRSKEHLRYKGHQIAPIELESVLLEHPGVTDAAVIGVPDEVCGDLPRAYVVLHNTSDYRSIPTVNQLIDFVHAHVSPYKYLRGGLEIVDCIPKSQSGKIMRKVLQERAMSSKSKL